MIYGTVKLKNINCNFSFDNWILSITFPSIDDISDYFGVDRGILLDSFKLNEQIITGWDSSNYYHFKIQNSIFEMDDTFTCHVSSFLAIDSFFTMNSKIDEMMFYSDELDYVSESYNCIKVNKYHDFVIRKKMPVFMKTSSIMQFKNQQIKVKFNRDVGRNSFSTTPYVLSGSMCYSFDKTNDYLWILELPNTAYKIMTFLCRRKNVNFKNIKLYCNREIVGNIFFNNQYESEKLNMKFIPYSLLGSKFGGLFTDIANDSMAIHYYPDSLKNDKIITQGSYLALSSAFEFEYDNHYELKRKKEELDSEEQFKELLKQLNCSGKYLSEFKANAIKFVNRPSLEGKIHDILTHYPSIALFCKRKLFRYREFNINGIAKRFADQRNIFAHGRIKEDFIEEVVYDYVLLEYLIYFMQFKTHGYSSIETLNIIGHLFKSSEGIAPKNESEFTNIPKEVLYEDVIEYACGKIDEYSKIVDELSDEKNRLDVEIRIDFDDRYNYGLFNDKYVMIDIIEKKVYDLTTDNLRAECEEIIKKNKYKYLNTIYSSDNIKLIIKDMVYKYDELCDKKKEKNIDDIYDLISSLSPIVIKESYYDSIEISNRIVKNKMFSCDILCENIKVLIIISEKKLLNSNYLDEKYQLLFSKIKEQYEL